jgi:hypothetical protein
MYCAEIGAATSYVVGKYNPRCQIGHQVLIAICHVPIDSMSLLYDCVCLFDPFIGYRSVYYVKVKRSDVETSLV